MGDEHAHRQPSIRCVMSLTGIIVKTLLGVLIKLLLYPWSSFDFDESFCLHCVQSILDEVTADLIPSFRGVSNSVQEAVSNLSGEYGFNLPLSAFMADVVQGITERKPVQLVGLSGYGFQVLPLWQRTGICPWALFKRYGRER
jgi:hypothetical protein